MSTKVEVPPEMKAIYDKASYIDQLIGQLAKCKVGAPCKSGAAEEVELALEIIPPLAKRLVSAIRELDGMVRLDPAQPATLPEPMPSPSPSAGEAAVTQGFSKFTLKQ